jgi:hypothetical protein
MFSDPLNLPEWIVEEIFDGTIFAVFIFECLHMSAYFAPAFRGSQQHSSISGRARTHNSSVFVQNKE